MPRMLVILAPPGSTPSCPGRKDLASAASCLGGERGQHVAQRVAPVRLLDTEYPRDPAAIEQRIQWTPRRCRIIHGRNRLQRGVTACKHGMGKLVAADRRRPAEMIGAPIGETGPPI